jgi:teichuronic acid biosynthesis glycosyltransferase TuaC
MRILAIPKDFPAAGNPVPGVFVLRQLETLQARGHEVRVLRVVPHAPPLSPKWRAYRAVPARYTYEGISVKAIRAFVPPRMLWLDAVRHQVAGKIRREILDFKPDVVHAHFLIPPGLFVKDVGVPTVLTAWGSDAYDWVWARRDLHSAGLAAVGAATVVCAVSGSIGEQVKSLGRSDVRVIFKGANESEFYPMDREAARTTLAVELDRPVIAFAGLLHSSKGVFELAQAIAALASLRPIVLIAGEGPDKNRLERQFALGHVDARFLGVLSHRELARVFAAASAVVLPSYGEGLPAVVCEAMLAGRCVVATAVGGIPEVITQGQTGCLVPVRDVGALERSLHQVLTDNALRRRLEIAARAFALENLTWQSNARSCEDAYRSAIASFHRVDVA